MMPGIKRIGLTVAVLIGTGIREASAEQITYQLVNYGYRGGTLGGSITGAITSSGGFAVSSWTFESSGPGGEFIIASSTDQGAGFTALDIVATPTELLLPHSDTIGAAMIMYDNTWQLYENGAVQSRNPSVLLYESNASHSFPVWDSSGPDLADSQGNLIIATATVSSVPEPSTIFLAMASGLTLSVYTGLERVRRRSMNRSV